MVNIAKGEGSDGPLFINIYTTRLSVCVPLYSVCVYIIHGEGLKGGAKLIVHYLGGLILARVSEPCYYFRLYYSCV